MQELLDHLRDKVSELQAEQMAPGPLQQDHSPTEAWETQEQPPAGALRPSDNVLQALRRLHSPKMMRKSGCFGRRLDRIGSLSGLGCNGKAPSLLPWVTLPYTCGFHHWRHFGVCYLQGPH